jgi:hypothetical protein
MYVWSVLAAIFVIRFNLTSCMLLKENGLVCFPKVLTYRTTSGKFCVYHATAFRPASEPKALACDYSLAVGTGVRYRK